MNISSGIRELALTHDFEMVSRTSYKMHLKKKYDSVTISMTINASHEGRVVTSIQGFNRSGLALLDLSVQCYDIDQFADYMEGVYKIMDTSRE